MTPEEIDEAVERASSMWSTSAVSPAPQGLCMIRKGEQRGERVVCLLLQQQFGQNRVVTAIADPETSEVRPVEPREVQNFFWTD